MVNFHNLIKGKIFIVLAVHCRYYVTHMHCCYSNSALIPSAIYGYYYIYEIIIPFKLVSLNNSHCSARNFYFCQTTM